MPVIPRIPAYLGRILRPDGIPVGTCFQISRGILVTAWHILDNLGCGTAGSVVDVDTLNGADGEMKARVIRLDSRHDLAVLKLTAEMTLPGTVSTLCATDGYSVGEQIHLIGAAEVPGVSVEYRYIEAVGTWQGGTTREDGTSLGRLSCRDGLRGMSGAPVRHVADNTVIGIVSGRYNSADGWLRDSVWVARTEDLGPLLDGLTRVEIYQPKYPYFAKVRSFVPQELVARDDELNQLETFCAGPEQFLWLQASPLAGKTALASWFALNPQPSTVQVASFFVRRDADGSPLDTYLRAITGQLARIAGNPLSGAQNQSPDEGVLEALLEQAAKKVRSNGGHLLLIVDGLDEDQSPQNRRIATRLPRRLPENAHLLVTSRQGPELEVPADHPIHHGRVLELAPWRDASAYEQEARAELDHWIRAGRAHRDITGLLAFANGGLTAGELTELISGLGNEPGIVDPSQHLYEMRNSLVTTVRELHSEKIYLFAHDVLRSIARTSLAESSERYRQRIHDLADHYRVAGWPDQTPRYFFVSYPGMLADSPDMNRLVELLSDQARHDRMRAIAGTDSLAFAELRDADSQSVGTGLTGLAMLASERDRIMSRNHAIPEDLPAVWAQLGYTEHALALAGCIPNTDRRRNALVKVVKAVPDVGEARRIADSFVDLRVKAMALATVGGRLADVSILTEAKRIWENMGDAAAEDHDLRTALLVGLAQANPESAERLICEDTDVRRFEEAMPDVVEAMYENSPDCARRLVERARHMSASNAADEFTRGQLARIAVAAARRDPDQARALLELIEDYYDQLRVKAALAANPGSQRSDELLSELQQAVTVAGAYGDYVVLAIAGPVVAGINPDRAEELAARIADNRELDTLVDVLSESSGLTSRDAVPFISSLTVAEKRARTLTMIADVLVPTQPAAAQRLARQADEQVDPATQARACAVAAIAAGGAALHQAFNTADAIPDLAWRAWALAGVACSGAAAGQPGWQEVARVAEKTAVALPDTAIRGKTLAVLIAATAPANPAWALRLTRRARRATRQLGRNDEEDKVAILCAAARGVGQAATQHRGTTGWSLRAQIRRLAQAAEGEAARVRFADERARLLADVAQAVAPWDRQWAARTIQPAIAASWENYPEPEPFNITSVDRSAANEYMADIILVALSAKPCGYARIGCDKADGQPHTPWEAQALAGTAAVLVNEPGSADAANLANLAERAARRLPTADLQADALASVAEAYAVLDGDRAAAIALEASRLVTSESLTSGTVAARLATAAKRSGRGDIRQAAIQVAASALAGRMWIDALPAVVTLEPGSTPTLCARLSTNLQHER